MNETKIDEPTLLKEGVKNQIETLGFPLDMQYWNCCKPPNKGYAGTAILINPGFGGTKPLRVDNDIAGFD